MASAVHEAIANDDAKDLNPDEAWVDGFEAGFSYSKDCELRLDCVRQAVASTGHSSNDVLKLAREMYQFVIGATCDDCGAPLGDGEATVQ